MKDAIVYDANDIKKMLAEKHGVKQEAVLKNQYSYTVVLSEKDKATVNEVPAEG